MQKNVGRTRRWLGMESTWGTWVRCKGNDDRRSTGFGEENQKPLKRFSFKAKSLIAIAYSRIVPATLMETGMTHSVQRLPARPLGVGPSVVTRPMCWRGPPENRSPLKPAWPAPSRRRSSGRRRQAHGAGSGGSEPDGAGLRIGSRSLKRLQSAPRCDAARFDGSVSMSCWILITVARSRYRKRQRPGNPQAAE